MVHLRARLARFIRTRRGRLPQREFARRTGLAQSTIMRIENLEQNVTLDTLEQLCRVFRVDVDELFPAAPAPHAYPEFSPAVGLIQEKPGTAPPAVAGTEEPPGRASDARKAEKKPQSSSRSRK